MQNPRPSEEQPTVTNQSPVFSSPRENARVNAAATALNQTPVPPYAPHYNTAMPTGTERQSAARERMRRRRVQSRNRGSEWAWVIVAAAIFGIVVVGSLSLFIILQASQTQAEVIPTAAVVLPTPVDARDGFGKAGQGGEQITLNNGRSITLIPWDGNSRFTVLVAGLDRRPGETGLAYRTDTMMLVSIDPATKSIGILSIPRDLYVEVPGYSELQRVNSSMVLGELQRPGYGPELMMQTVQYNLGIRVHDYVAVDFNTFITVIDAIGGIDMNIPYSISDPAYPDMNYGYDPFYIRAGFQHLDGKTALKYARTRHGDSDFGRAQRQQAVLYAIRDRVLSVDMLPQLIVQAPTIWNAISSGVSTGLSFEQILQLLYYLKDIPAESIKTGVIDERYTMGYMTPRGASVLVPDRAKLGGLMVEVFGPNYSQ